jgi:hypothetical protein
MFRVLRLAAAAAQPEILLAHQNGGLALRADELGVLLGRHLRAGSAAGRIFGNALKIWTFLSLFCQTARFASNI